MYTGIDSAFAAAEADQAIEMLIFCVEQGYPEKAREFATKALKHGADPKVVEAELRGL